MNPLAVVVVACAVLFGFAFVWLKDNYPALVFPVLMVALGLLAWVLKMGA